MTHTYTITGMTCNNCRSKVEKALNAVEGIKATVTLKPPEVVISMQKQLPIVKLHKIVAAIGPYTIIKNSTLAQKTKKLKEKSCCNNPSHDDKLSMAIPNNENGKYY